MVGTSHAREENGGKSDPRVRLLVKECGRDTCQIYSSGHEDELAAGKSGLTVPGRGNLLKRNHLPLPPAAACSGAGAGFPGGLGLFLLGPAHVWVCPARRQKPARGRSV